MKTLKLSKLILAALLALPTFAFGDGGINGGGGGAFVCRNPDGTIKKAMLVDLWESERTPFWGQTLNIPRTNEDPDKQFENAVKKLDAINPELADMVRQQGKEIWDNRKFIKDDEEIPVPPDLKALRAPKGCPPTGLMFYSDTVGLDVDKEVHDALETKTDVAAARAHEAIYKVFRLYFKQQTSRYTRRLVACLFSDNEKCLHTMANLIYPGQKYYHCKNNSVNVTLFPGYFENPEKHSLADRENIDAYIHSLKTDSEKDIRLKETIFATVRLGDQRPIRFEYGKEEESKAFGPLAAYGYYLLAGMHTKVEDGGIILTGLKLGLSIPSLTTNRTTDADIGKKGIKCRPFIPTKEVLLNGNYDESFFLKPSGNIDSAKDSDGNENHSSAE